MALLVMVFVSRGSAGVSRIADCSELNITFGGSEVFEPLDDVFAGVPAALTFRAGSGRCAAFDRFAFHGHVDLLWRTQVSQLSECPAPASESSRHNPFPSSMRS